MGRAIRCDQCGQTFAQQGDNGYNNPPTTEWGYILTYAEMDWDVKAENHSSAFLHRQCVPPWLEAFEGGS